MEPPDRPWLYQVFVNASPYGVALFERVGDRLGCVFINRAGARITSIEEGDWLCSKALIGLCLEAIAQRSPLHRVVPFLEGGCEWLDVHVQVQGDRHIILHLRDATLDQHAKFRDPLTGLHHREALPAVGPGKRGAVYIDLDRFKEINDDHGHLVGDELLKAIAQKLQELAQHYGGQAFRMGGDEFLLIVPEKEEDVAVIALKLIHSTSYKGVSCSASIGVAADDDYEQAYSHAEVVSRVAKGNASQSAEARIVPWDSAIARQVEEQHKLERLVSRPPSSDTYSLVYQPIVDIRDGTIVACEALLRISAEWGYVSPAQAIATAEALNTIGLITNWVLDRAIADLKQWEAIAPVPVSINVAPWELDDPFFARRVLKRLSLEAVNPAQVCIEITERGLYSRLEDFLHNLMELRVGHLILKRDDFGTGSSGLEQLKRFRFDEIKLDKALLPSDRSDRQNHVICKAMIVMARSLGFSLTAEGVETEEQHNILLDIGITHAQGFYYHRPMPLPAFIELLQRQASTEASGA